MTDGAAKGYIDLTANIVSAHLSNNPTPASEIANLISQAHSAWLRAPPAHAIQYGAGAIPRQMGSARRLSDGGAELRGGALATCEEDGPRPAAAEAEVAPSRQPRLSVWPSRLPSVRTRDQAPASLLRSGLAL